MLVFFFVDAALSSILEEVLRDYNYNNPAPLAGLMGWLGYLTGVLGSLAFAALARKATYLKCLIIICCIATTGSLAAFTFVVPTHKSWPVGIIFLIYQSFNTAVCPLLLEMGAELTFPIGESISAGLIESASQLSNIIMT